MQEEKSKKDNSLGSRLIIHFAPKTWGQVTKFIRFHSPTYRFSRVVNSALSGTQEHFDRYLVLKNLSKRLAPELDKDYRESIEKGYSQAIHSKELAAIIDNSFCELYSSVDCTRRVIAAIYGKYRGIGIDSKSTSGLFENASKHIIDKRVPLEIRKALEDGYNDWFPRLKEIRDSLNHYSIGSCSDFEGRHKGELEPKVSYSHDLLGDDMGNVLVTNDVFKMISEFEVKVNLFQGSVYHALNQTLEGKETTQVCGFFGGRIYLRLVSPKEAIDFNSGKCYSRIYFEKEEMQTCPFVAVCGAYKNSKSEDN